MNIIQVVLCILSIIVEDEDVIQIEIEIMHVGIDVDMAWT